MPMGEEMPMDAEMPKPPEMSPGVDAGNLIQMGGATLPTININNLYYLYLNEKLTKNVAKVIIYVYVTSSLNGKKSRCNKDIEELLTYAIEVEKNKHITFLNYFKTDNNFKIALDSNNNLYKLLVTEYLKESLGDKKIELLDEQQNQVSKNNCTRHKDELDILIETGGSFTRKEALFLEFCDKAFDRFF